MSVFIEELVARLGLELNESQFEKATKALESLRLGLAGIGAIAAAAGSAILAMAHSTAETAIETVKAAQKTGTSVAALQELKFAAEQVNVSAETMETGLIRLSRSVYNATHFSKEAGFSFRELGVSVYDTNGQVKPTDQLLGDISARFQKLPDGINKVALATKIFGRGGAEMIPLLNKGRDGIDQLRKAAYDYGVVLDEDVIAASERWEQQQKHLTAALRGLKFAIGGEFLKRLGNVTDKIADWVRQNRELITTRLFQFIDATKQLLMPLVDLLDKVIVQTGAWKYALAALAAIFALMNLPLLAFIAALLAIEDIYGFLQGKDSVLAELFPPEDQQKIRDLLQNIRDFFTYITGGQLGSDLADWWANSPLKKIVDFFSSPRSQATGIGAPATAQQLADSTPMASLAPSQKYGGDWLKTAAHYLFGPGDLENAVSLTSPPAIPGTSAVNANSSVAITQTINAAPGMDPKEIADRSADRLREVLQSMNRETLAAINQ